MSMEQLEKSDNYIHTGNNITPDQNKKFIFVILLVLVIITVLISLNFRLNNNRTLYFGRFNFLKPAPSPIVSPSPSPFPFAELTIPYLRQRTYESNLGPLDKYGENQDFTTYLTSYDSDGLTINGLLTKPKGEMPVGGWPAIIFVHGYIPPTLYKTTSNYTSYVNYLAKNEFVVFKIDLRGHDKSEGKAGGAYYSGDYIIDVLNARVALQTSSFVNPYKIGLWGHSMAGNVLLRSFAVKPEIPAVVIWAGAVYTYEDRLKYGIDDNSYRPPTNDSERQRKRQLLRDTWGEFDPTVPFWQQVAPTNYLSDFKGAIQLHHAVDDTVVNIGYSRNLMSLLDKTAVPHELHEYKTGGHNLAGASFAQAMDRTIAFFKENL